jgi:hypothetical protein
MDLIMVENSLFESQQYINWAKLFYSARLYAEGQTFKAVEELEKTMEEYVNNLEGDYFHPFVEQFHQQIGNMYFKL